MRGLNLSQAVQIADGALAKARELRCKPMTVAVVDAGGALLVLKREDGSGNLRPDIAFAKRPPNHRLICGPRGLARTRRLVYLAGTVSAVRSVTGPIRPDSSSGESLL
jgi:hypothetical protein